MMTYNKFFGTIKNIEGTPFNIETELKALEKSFNNARRWGFECKFTLKNKKGDIEITILDPKKGKEDLILLADKILHFDENYDFGGYLETEVINIRETL